MSFLVRHLTEFGIGFIKALDFSYPRSEPNF